MPFGTTFRVDGRCMPAQTSSQSGNLPSMRRVPALVLLLAAPQLAHAAFPERLSVLAMEDFGGARTEAFEGDDYVAAGWKEVVLELGTALSNKPVAPARTLGPAGFHVDLGTTFAHLPGRWLDGSTPDGWELMDPDEDAPSLLYIPTVHVRKGLPASLEVGANFGWIGGSDTGVVGGYGRVGLVEGYPKFPDISLQAGYSAYIGNDEFELGAMDFSTNIGYTLPFGPVEGIHTAKFSPFVSFGLTRIHAAPRLDLSDTRLDGRLVELTGFEGDTFDESMAPFTFAGGFEVQSGTFTFLLSSGYAVGGSVTFNLGLGFTY
jgi:hypothetical protein